MAWSAPMTAVASTAFTAAQFNTFVRDNLNETAPAKATVAGQIFVSTAANSIAARVPSTAIVATSETTASVSWVDLATAGPAVTVTTGTQALVSLYCDMSNSSASGFTFMGFAISGATTLAAANNTALQISGTTTAFRLGHLIMVTGLTAGSNTFTAKYQVGTAGTGTWLDRHITVIPL